MEKLAQALPFVLVIALLGVAGLYLAQSPASPATAYALASRMERVSLGYVPGPFNAIPIVALRKGFFAEEGVQVEEVRASFIGYIFQQLAGGKLDLITGGETPAVLMALKGGDFTILAKHLDRTDGGGSNGTMRIVARTDSGIRSINDITGKRIGFPFFSVSHYNLWRLEQENGIEPSTVTEVDISPQNMAAALGRGDVDAVYIWEPVPSRLISGLGAQVRAFTPPARFTIDLYASKPLSQRKGVEVKVMRALLRAQQFLREHPDEAIAIVAKDTAMDESTLRSLWNDWQFNLTTFASGDIDLLKKEAAWAIENRLVNDTRVPDFSTLVDSGPLREALAHGA